MTPAGKMALSLALNLRPGPEIADHLREFVEVNFEQVLSIAQVSATEADEMDDEAVDGAADGTVDEAADEAADEAVDELGEKAEDGTADRPADEDLDGDAEVPHDTP